MKIEIKCVECDKRLTVGKVQTEQPICPECGMPMIAVKSVSDERSLNEWVRRGWTRKRECRQKTW